MSNSTIAAISTAIGVSAISIVRLSGANALKIAKILTKSHDLAPRYAHLKFIYNTKGEIIDRGIVIYFKAPHSYNGEDIVEFQTHGGIATPKAILSECVRLGARLANPGEFSKIALLNGKMDVNMLEGISRLIMSQSAESTAILARILKGDLGKFVESLREEILRILARIEVAIDYAEEDIADTQASADLLGNAIEKLSEILAHSRSVAHIINGHKMAIIGRPNVGKSSILNALLLKDRAIVADIPGTTRDSIEASLTIANQIVQIIDTAGIRHKDKADKIEGLGIQKSMECAREATIIAAVFDGSKAYDDDEIMEILAQNREKIIIAVINKSDKPQVFDERKIAPFECVHISTKDSSVFKLRDLIASKIATRPLNSQDIILSSARQIACVEKCLASLQNARECQNDAEITSFHLREALDALDLLCKPFDNEEMLDILFSEFCLGK